MTDNIFLKNIKESAGIRLAVLFGSFFLLLIVSSLIAAGISSAPIGSERSHTLWISAVQCVLAFCLPAFLSAKFSAGNNWKEWLELTKLPGISSITGLILIYGFSMPAMEWLIQWNANLHLPASMSGFEATLREWETNAEATTNLILNVTGFWSVIAGVAVIGLLTGFSEELFFRGGLQGILTRTNLNKDLAVWCAAFIFSLMHFQFFGFVPRLIMGAFFGYLLLWTRSIWMPMLAHMLNNSAVVISAAINGVPENSVNENMAPYIDNPWIVAGSFIITALFLIIFRKEFFKTSKTRWLRKQVPQVTEN